MASSRRNLLVLLVVLGLCAASGIVLSAKKTVLGLEAPERAASLF